MPRASELNPATIAAYRQAFGIDAIAAIATSGLTFVGAWAANGAAPTPTANGQYWIVSVAGTTNLGGVSSWGVGDWAIFKGAGVWVKAPNQAEGLAQQLANDLASTAAGKGGELVAFLQSGAGALPTTTLEKLREAPGSPAEFSEDWKADPQEAIQYLIDASALLANNVIQIPNGNVTIAGNLDFTNKPLTLQLGKGTYTIASGASIKINGNKNVQISGRGAGVTKLLGTSVGQKLIEFTGQHPGSYLERLTKISGLTLDGAGVADYGVFAGDNNYGTFSMIGMNVYEDVVATGFQVAGIHHGRSNYFLYFNRCHFELNAAGVQTGAQTDAIYTGCLFGKHTVAGIKCEGTQQRYLACSFTGQGAAGPDILIAASEPGGTIYIGDGCYFGSEDDAAGRYKIVCDAPNGDSTSNVTIKDSFFYGVAGQKAIKINTPIKNWSIDGNIFQGFDIIIDDVSPLTASSDVGSCQFGGDNIIANYDIAQNTRVFTNSGRYFNFVTYPENTAGITIPDPTAGAAQNRLWYSEDFTSAIDAYSWGASAGVTVTGSQADSAGTTKAAKIEKPAASSKSIFGKIDLTNAVTDLGDAASGPNGRVHMRLRLKKGSLSTADIGIYNNTDFRFIFKQRVMLTSVFRSYRFTVAGLDPAKSYSVAIYPGGVSHTTVGDLFVEFPSVSDYGSDYVSTSGAAVGV